MNIHQFRTDGVEFPDLFPRSTWAETAYAIMRNVPKRVEREVYHFCLKQNETVHSPASIILQKGGNILFNKCQHFGDDSRLKTWVATHTAQLHGIAKQRELALTIVGKIKNGKFAVYYVIDDGLVYLDAPSIRVRLGIHKVNAFEQGLEVVPHLQECIMVIDKSKGVVAMDALQAYSNCGLLGFPVESETRDDSAVPRLFTDPTRMRHLCFVYEAP